MNICVVAENYPAEGHPFFAFVENLCVNIVKEGHKVYVIAPQSLSQILLRGIKRLPYKSIQNGVIIYRPLYITTGNFSVKYNYSSFARAVSRVFPKIQKEIDVCYGHFWHSAYCLYPSALKYNKPLFVATGECEIELHQFVVKDKLKDFINYVKGVICVSTKNKDESISAGLLLDQKFIVVPNAIDNNIFKQLDRKPSRNHFKLLEDDFVVAFVGGFIQRKGPGRVAAAIEKINNEKIKSIFIGYCSNGVIEYPECKGIVFRDKLKHDEIPFALNAADVFVMPTLHEGCCNSIIEAMACGLPVISSDRSFNYDVLNDTNSILIDPMSVDEVANAIRTLKEDKILCNKLKQGATESAKQLTIQLRARKIIDFISQNS